MHFKVLKYLIKFVSLSILLKFTIPPVSGKGAQVIPPLPQQEELQEGLNQELRIKPRKKPSLNSALKSYQISKFLG